jgi:hypothetical protein
MICKSAYDKTCFKQVFDCIRELILDPLNLKKIKETSQRTLIWNEKLSAGDWVPYLKIFISRTNVLKS